MLQFAFWKARMILLANVLLGFTFFCKRETQSWIQFQINKIKISDW